MHERLFCVLKYALQVAFFQTQTFLHLVTEGLFWFNMLLIILAHCPYFGQAGVYLRRGYGWEHVFTFAFGFSSLMLLCTIASIKYDIANDTAYYIEDLYSRNPGQRDLDARRALHDLTHRKLYGLDVYQWRAMTLYLLSVSFCHLLLACMSNLERQTDRFLHAWIVFGNWFLYVDHTQLTDPSDASVRMVPIFLFGVFVCFKKAMYPGRRKVETSSRWFNEKGPVLCVFLWLFSAVSNVFSAVVEDRDESFIMPMYLIWFAITGCAFLSTVLLVCTDYKRLRPPPNSWPRWIQNSLLVRCLRRFPALERCCCACCPSSCRRRGADGDIDSTTPPQDNSQGRY
ncbi:unnamed protein product [Amoebophrya sp. A120]|nr:unnamed protein product [Amoebophrya sp. A120]|eukprot:GSA120T00021374001.1